MAHPHIKPDPDHVPHDVVGILAISVVGFALITGVVWMAFGGAPAMILLAIGFMWFIARLARRADREREEEAIHPKPEPPIDPHDRAIS